MIEEEEHNVNGENYQGEWSLADIDWQTIFELGEEENGMVIPDIPNYPASSSSSSYSSSSSPQRNYPQPEQQGGGVSVSSNSSGGSSPSFPSEDVDLTLPPKRRVRRANNFPFLKILKSDVRHKFSLMHANVMNSMDVNSIKSFYEAFYVRSCQYFDCVQVEVNDDSPCHILQTYKPVSICGLDDMIRRLSPMCSYLPDYSLQLLHSYINRQIDQPGSRIIMQVAIHATAIKNCVVAIRALDRNRYLVPFFMVNELIRAGKVDGNDMGLEEHPPDAQCMSLNVRGELIFWLDNNNRIYRMQSLGNLKIDHHD
eukprot:gene633-688_t